MTDRAGKVGLLVMAYGTPETLDDVEPYLTHIRHGRTPSAEQVKDLKDRYEQIGGPSPLHRTTVEQMGKLEAKLNEGDESYTGFLGMKHWHPYIADAVRTMAEAGVVEAVAITLAPHYSTMSIAQYLDFIAKGLDSIEWPTRILCIKSYHEEPLFIDALEERLREAMARIPESERASVPVIFTAHSLPEKILQEDDPYPDQLLETCRLLAARFDALNWRFAFTSQGETKDDWLGPTLAEALSEVAAEGHKSVLAATVGFVSEHLETLYDFDIDGRREAEERGLRFYRAAALNTSDKYIAALAEIVRKARAGEHSEVAVLPGGEDLQAPTYPTYS